MKGIVVISLSMLLTSIIMVNAAQQAAPAKKSTYWVEVAALRHKEDIALAQQYRREKKPTTAGSPNGNHGKFERKKT